LFERAPGRHVLIRPMPAMEVYRPDDPRHRSAVQAALRTLARDSHESIEIDHAHVLVGEDLVYLPCGYIGSVGVLFVPSTAASIRLGSYTTLSDFLWAYDRGIDLAGETAPERHNRMAITAIADRPETLQCLRQIFNGPFMRAAVMPGLETLPFTVADVDLYFAIPHLRRAEQAGHFEFEIS
jgi:hypothetical protein